jgi:hypothetical protein
MHQHGRNMTDPTPLSDSDGSVIESPAEATSIDYRPSGRTLELADTCFEVFSLRELRKPKSILHELTASYPDLSLSEVTRAVSIALSWKRLLRAGARRIH